MDLWRDLETITRNLNSVAGKGEAFMATPPLVKLNEIKNLIHSEGITYPQACYVQEMASRLNVDHNILREDFHGSASMMHVHSFGRVLDEVISRVNKLK